MATSPATIAKFKAAGICLKCFKLAMAPGHTSCQSCLDKEAERRRQRTAELKAKGVCISCGINLVDDQRVRCRGCSESGNLACRASQQRLKVVVLNHYGGICQCCGENNIIFLTIDHIDGNGGIQRKDTNTNGSHSTYNWLKSNNYPSGYQVLCLIVIMVNLLTAIYVRIKVMEIILSLGMVNIIDD